MADPESKFALMAKEAGISGFEQAEKNLIELEDKIELVDKKDDTDTEDDEVEEGKKDKKEDMVDGPTKPYKEW